MTVALNVLADWCEDNLTSEVATWTRGGFHPLPSDDQKTNDFIQAVAKGGMLPLLKDALEEVSVPVPTARHELWSRRPGYEGFITVATDGYGVVRRKDGRLHTQWFCPSSAYSKAKIVRGPFERLAHAHIWMLVLRSQEKL